MMIRNLSLMLGAMALSAQALAASPTHDARHAPAARTKLTAARVASASYIVQAPSFPMAVAAVKNAGGKITHELSIINAVAATLTPAQVTALRADRSLNLTPNGSASVAGTSAPYAVRYTQADLMHAMGITGKGVSIAFVDTGLWATPRAGYDAINNLTLSLIHI